MPPGPLVDAAAIVAAADVLRRGGLVAFPTETVYGLGADALSAAALARIYAVKGRPATHPLIVHLAKAEWLPDWARDVPPAAVALADRFWPGPLTMVLPRANGVPDAVTGGQDTVGVRVPGHPVALALLEAFGRGVAAPSANRFGKLSPTTAAHVRADLGDEVDVILDGGACEVGIESTIVDLSRGAPVLLRPGWITADQIETCIGEDVAAPDRDAPRVPGSLDAHYAPRTPLEILPPTELGRRLARGGERLAVLAFAELDNRPTFRPDGSVAVDEAAPSSAGVRGRSKRRADSRSSRGGPGGRGPTVALELVPRDAAQYARDLYAALRRLDTAGADRILVEAVPDDAAWMGVADRLKRAAAKR